MAIVRVQEANNANNTTSVTTTLLSAATSGNCILIGLGSSASGNFGTSVTDTAGNSYSLVGSTHSTNTSNYISEFWVAKNITGGFTNVTAHYNSAASTQVLFVIEYSGVSHSTPTGVVGVLNNQGPGHPLSPLLTISATSALASIVMGSANTFSSVNAPWSFIATNSVWAMADYIPGVSGSYQATFNPSESTTWGSSGIELLAQAALTLTLTDSVPFSDVTTKEDETTFSDAISISDLAGVARGKALSDNAAMIDSFSLQSSEIVAVPTPAVEMLVNQLVPAEVKTFFEIE
jgi:hypothetical protein